MDQCTLRQFPGHLSPDSECGSSKACFHDCEGGQCTFIISWRNVDDDYIFMAMSYRVPDSNEHWIAVGFSKDQEMVSVLPSLLNLYHFFEQDRGGILQGPGDGKRAPQPAAPLPFL